MEAKVREGLYAPEHDLLILDGIPRNITQAALIKPYTTIFKVIFMVCEDREVMFKRIRGRSFKENRIDDSEEVVVRYRWDLYKRETEPLIDHYSQELIRIIDADTIPADVLHQIFIRNSAHSEGLFQAAPDVNVTQIPSKFSDWKLSLFSAGRPVRMSEIFSLVVQDRCLCACVSTTFFHFRGSGIFKR